MLTPEREKQIREYNMIECHPTSIHGAMFIDLLAEIDTLRGDISQLKNTNLYFENYTRALRRQLNLAKKHIKNVKVLNRLREVWKEDLERIDRTLSKIRGEKEC